MATPLIKRKESKLMKIKSTKRQNRYTKKIPCKNKDTISRKSIKLSVLIILMFAIIISTKIKYMFNFVYFIVIFIVIKKLT